MSCRPPSSVTLGKLSVKLLASNWKITHTQNGYTNCTLKKTRMQVNANDIEKYHIKTVC